jgi:hypothetical protein
MKPIFLFLLLLPIYADAKLGLGMRGGFVPNVLGCSDNPFAGSSTAVGAGGFGKVLLSLKTNKIAPALVVEYGILSNIEPAYQSTGGRCDFYLKQSNLAWYLGPELKYLYAAKTGDKHRGLDMEFHAGLDKRLSSRLHLNVEGGLRYIYTSQDVTVQWGHINGNRVNYETKHFKRTEVIGFPISVGLTLYL